MSAGTLEPREAREAVARHDVVITGGGLAGLTLALQLKQSFADLDILVLERRVHPVPVAAHKVGESTVEIGANYLGEVLGLKEHLETAQLRKFGFRFFSSEGRRDIDAVHRDRREPAARRAELADRPRHLRELPRPGGDPARRPLRGGATVRDVTLADDGGEHRVDFRHQGVEHEVARALAGRRVRPRRADQEEARARRAERPRRQRRLVSHRRADRDRRLVRRPGLARALHARRAVAVDQPPVGEGYWAWLIPLASGSHSVGIVCRRESCIRWRR